MPASALRSTLSVTLLFAIACAPANPRGIPSQTSAVLGEEIRNHPDEPIERVLQRKVPGLTVTRTPDGEIAVTIRGAHSFVGTDAPLYLLNGAPFVPGPGGVLSGVDSNSIEAIQVFKGADAALYGIQGMNGVIAITTRRPGK